MTSLNRIALVTLAIAALASPVVQSAANAQPPDQSHDFDFAFGTWQTHISVLIQSSNGAASWSHMNGTVATRKVWNGRANLEEIEADAGSGRFEGMTLRMYDPQAHQWYLYWSNSGDGTMGPAAVGRFSSRGGEFYDQEPIAGKAVFIRQRYYDVTPTSYRFEQAISNDGGAHWKANFLAALTREPTPLVTPAPVAALPAARHHFDWQFGSWNVQMSRLAHPLSGSSAWTRFNARVVVSKIWGGRANLAEIEADPPSGHLEFLALRLFQPQSGQWSLNFAGADSGRFGVPLFGSFKNGRGDFYDQAPYNGKTIWIRFSFLDIGSATARDEQAFSDDAGKTWKVNWINLHSRMAPRAPFVNPVGSAR